MREIPILPTAIVAAAVATMIALGIWQLGRMEEKEALIARYEAALADKDTIIDHGFVEPDALYRRAIFLCEEVSGIRQVAGRNAKGVSGWAYVARCKTGGSESYAPVKLPDYVIETVDVTIGWSDRLEDTAWTAGRVEGRVVAPYEQIGRVVADPPLAGLAANATPDPRDIPNNHLSYAVQWFLFAVTALVIYVLALRVRRRDV